MLNVPKSDFPDFASWMSVSRLVAWVGQSTAAPLRLTGAMRDWLQHPGEELSRDEIASILGWLFAVATNPDAAPASRWFGAEPQHEWLRQQVLARLAPVAA